MFLAFVLLFILGSVGGVLVWLGWRRIATHLNNNPEARRLFAEHVVNPLLLGAKAEETTPDGPDQSGNGPARDVFDRHVQ